MPGRGLRNCWSDRGFVWPEASLDAYMCGTAAYSFQLSSLGFEGRAYFQKLSGSNSDAVSVLEYKSPRVGIHHIICYNA